MSTTTAFTKGKLIVLRSNDGEIFEVEEAVAAESQTIKNMMEDVSVDDVITLPNVDGKTLSRVIEYCRKHVEASADPEKSDELKAFDSGFVNDVEWNALAELILAANYLNIKGLMDLTCQNAADRIKDKSVEEVRMMFDIENDYTPAEELAVRKEHLWAFE